MSLGDKVRASQITDTPLPTINTDPLGSEVTLAINSTYVFLAV